MPAATASSAWRCAAPSSPDPTKPGCSPAAASWPDRTRQRSWPRPRRSSPPSRPPWRAERRPRTARKRRLAGAPGEQGHRPVTGRTCGGSGSEARAALDDAAQAELRLVQQGLRVVLEGLRGLVETLGQLLGELLGRALEVLG